VGAAGGSGAAATSSASVFARQSGLDLEPDEVVGVVEPAPPFGKPGA
jgi:hypothetical protein